MFYRFKAEKLSMHGDMGCICQNKKCQHKGTSSVIVKSSILISSEFSDEQISWKRPVYTVTKIIRFRTLLDILAPKPITEKTRSKTGSESVS